jgi:hypothetical protein
VDGSLALPKHFKTERDELLGRPRHVWKDNIKMKTQYGLIQKGFPIFRV